MAKIKRSKKSVSNTNSKGPASLWLYGIHAVESALKNKKRHHKRILCTEKHFQRFYKIATPITPEIQTATDIVTRNNTKQKRRNSFSCQHCQRHLRSTINKLNLQHNKFMYPTFFLQINIIAFSLFMLWSNFEFPSPFVKLLCTVCCLLKISTNKPFNSDLQAVHDVNFQCLQSWIEKLVRLCSKHNLKIKFK